MFITTAGRTNQTMMIKAKNISDELQIPYISRKKMSIQSLQQFMKDDCIVVGKERLELFPLGAGGPFFFHPNSSMFRIKRLLEGENDPFVDACQLKKGKHFLDCTLGLASDSIVASYMVGDEGKVVGIEGERYLAYLTIRGLKSWKSDVSEFNSACERIVVVQRLSIDYLKKLKDDSFDIVYFDPMFHEPITESDGIRGLSRLAIYDDIGEELIEQAKRVARERVVLKDHFRSKRFERYGFQVKKRKTAKFHFGVMRIQ